MATETITLRFCDMPHTERTGAIDAAFPLLWQQSRFTVDLCNEHADALSSALAPFLDAAQAERRPLRLTDSSAATPRKRATNPNSVKAASLSAEEREWLHANGWAGRRVPAVLGDTINQWRSTGNKPS